MAASGFQHLTLDKRRSLFRVQGIWLDVSEVAGRLSRHRSTIYRELACSRFRDPNAPWDRNWSHLIRVSASTSKYSSAVTPRRRQYF